jgi:hypothetical protein
MRGDSRHFSHLICFGRIYIVGLPSGTLRSHRRQDMATLFRMGCWGGVVLAVVFALVGPNVGVLFSNPAAILGLGLVGLGLCKQARNNC